MKAAGWAAFELAAARWLVASQRSKVAVWRYADAYGTPRPWVTLALSAPNGVLLDAATVRL